MLEDLQKIIKKSRRQLQEVRFNEQFSTLQKKEKELFYNSLRLLNDFEDTIIINYILPYAKKGTKKRS